MGMDRPSQQEQGNRLDVPASAARVTVEAEVPEVLFFGMRRFLESHPQWDQYSLISSALAVFLVQNGCQDPCVSQHYLDALFLRP
jgi:hypothetical protein